MRRYAWAAAPAAGAATVLGFAPFGLAPVPLFTLALLFWLWRDADPGRAFRLGYLFGLGLLGLGVSWVHISIAQFSGGGIVLAWLITAALVGFMALFYGAAGWLGARATTDPAWRLILAFPGAWVLAEWVRGWFLTGFPWLSLGYSQVDSPVAGFAPVLGVFGVGGVLALSAGLTVWMLTRACGPRWWAAAALAGLWLGGAALRAVDWTLPAGDPFRVSMIQGNVTPDRKWDPALFTPTLDVYRGLTRDNWDSRLIIWPETAVPAFAHQVEDRLLGPMEREARARGTDLLIGIPVSDPHDGRYFNAMLALGPERASYFKRHLVPFGEFVPLRALFAPLGEALDIPMSDFSPGDGARPLVPLAGYHAAVSICYEDAFGEETIEALPEAAFLVNASNDAWFGDSLAPHQHLEIARVRSQETGRFMLRATNTGISAVIDDKGRVLERSPMFQRHVLSAEVVPMQGATPYVWMGNAGAVLLGLVGLAGALALDRRHRRPQRA
jgi:apolipoprotein N-acyltransferase